MFVVLLVISFMAFDKHQQGNLTINVTEAQEDTCEQLLDSESYKAYTDMWKKRLEKLGATEIEVINQDCMKIGDKA